ncbi:MAG TPA: YCF48-related protein [Candidatus Acidoferrales bacterium]|nr:YCF48-related protein [Candidatus Acidoferrales bacterium]
MASRERGDAMAGLLKRSLAGDAGAGNDCPEPEILAAYFERSLDADETAQIELHLSECARCREQFAALGRAEAEAPAPSVADARRKSPRASWMWDWRWLAPVTAVLVITAIWATRRPALTQIANHVAQPPASLAVSRPAPPVQPPPAPAPEKKTTLSRIAPAVGVPATRPKVPSQSESVAVNSGDREKSVEVERSPLQSLQSSKSVRDLPTVGRNYTELDSLSKKAPEPQPKATEDAANAPPRATNESVMVESQVAPVHTSPAGAPVPPKAENGVAAGILGGAISSGTTNAKQEPAAVNRLATVEMAEAIATTREQRAASFVVQTPDPKIVWRIGNAGFVEHSEDGGATWHGTLPKQNARYVAGSAPSANVCWIVGNDGIILLTKDAKHWQTIPPPLRTDFVAIAARDAWSATVTTADGRKFTTSDQGASWTAAK